MYKFIDVLREIIKDYFINQYGIYITDEQADQYLDSLDDFFEVFIFDE